MAYHNWKRFSDPEMDTMLRHLRVMLRGKKAIITMFVPPSELDVSVDKALDRVMATNTPEIQMLTPKTRITIHYTDKKSRNRFWLDITEFDRTIEKMPYPRIETVPHFSYSKDALDARDVYDIVKDVLEKNEGWKI